MTFVLAFRGSALLRTPLRKSFICWMKYETGRPETPAFSCRPFPFGMWQSAHARASGRLPCATMSGIAGWSPGNQSAGPKPSEICCRVKLSVLPGSCLIEVSGAGGAAPGVGGSGMAYAHAGGSPTARSTEVATRGATTSATSGMNLRIQASVGRRFSAAELYAQSCWVPRESAWEAAPVEVDSRKST